MSRNLSDKGLTRDAKDCVAWGAPPTNNWLNTYMQEKWPYIKEMMMMTDRHKLSEQTLRLEDLIKDMRDTGLTRAAARDRAT